MHHTPWDGRVLSIYATSRGFAFTVFEGPQSLVDWGVKQLKGKQKNPRVLKQIRVLIEQYPPDALVIEDCAVKGSRRSPRIRRLYRSIEALAASEAVEVHCYSRAQLRQCFSEGFGASTKQEIAQAIVTLLPELAHRVPPVRKLWQSEDPRMGIFDAAALVLAFFRFDAEQLTEG